VRSSELVLAPSTPSSYTIRLDNIRFRARHGVSDSERDLPQDFLVTVEISLPVTALPASDRMQDVFDYDRISSIVVEEGTRQPYKLLERFGARLIERLLTDTPATRAKVAITKLRPPTEASVDSVTVELSS
jgi:7,8-dihydroneopterin aldolase/epimerase/oxygenase